MIDLGNNHIVCYPALAFLRNTQLRNVYACKYPGQDMVPKDDMCLIMKNILVLRDEHIECVNAVGIDEIPDVAFYVMSKGSEQYVQFTTDGTPYICQASFDLFKMTHTTVSRPYVRKLHPEEHHPIRIDDNVW